MILGVVWGLVAVNAEGCDSWCLEVPHWLALRPVDSLYPHSGFMPISSHKLLVPALFPILVGVLFSFWHTKGKVHLHTKMLGKS